MKSMILVAALMAASVSAHASSIVCSTRPAPGMGSQYVAAIESADETGETVAHLSLHGGMAHFIVNLGSFPVSVDHFGPEVVRFSSPENEFELEVTYVRMGGQLDGMRGFPGTVKMKGTNGPVDAPVVCR